MFLKSFVSLIAQSQLSEFFVAHVTSLRSGTCVTCLWLLCFLHSLWNAAAESSWESETRVLALPRQGGLCGQQKQGGIWQGDSDAPSQKHWKASYGYGVFVETLTLMSVCVAWETIFLFHSKSSSQISGCGNACQGNAHVFILPADRLAGRLVLCPELCSVSTPRRECWKC